MKTKQHPTELKKLVVTKHRAGLGYKKISKLLSVPISTVRNIIKTWKMRKSVKSAPKPGRPRKVSNRLRSKLVREAKANPSVTLTELKQSAAEVGVEVSQSTVSRVLHSGGLFGRVARKKPLLKQNHKKARLQFARAHINDTPEQWSKVLWSDETKMELFGVNQKKYVWRESGGEWDPDKTVPTVKHGRGSVMLWGCFAAAGTGRLVKIDGIMNGEKYREILEENLLTSASDLKLRRNFKFQQDNDPKHTARATSEWFRNKKVKVLDWPSQSPDLNPIENLWHRLKVAVHKRSPRNLTELVQFCQEEWKKIPPSACRKLVEGYPKRLTAVIDAKGAATKY